MNKIIDYLKELGATTVTIVTGPNGDFLSYKTPTGTVIATVNNYNEVASFTL